MAIENDEHPDKESFDITPGRILMQPSRTNFNDVGEFHHKFGLHSVTHRGAGPTMAMDVPELLDFRRKFMQEELDEFVEGMEEGDIAKMADALVDLAYVVKGTAHLLGLPWQELWADVQRANMSKRRAARDGSDSKRNSRFDVVKPEGWQGPQTELILRRFGFDVRDEPLL